jgi:Ca-activated chloride channel family protein
MFTITAYNNQYLRLNQNTMQAVLSIGADADASLALAPLAIALALDHSGSMDGERMSAARDGAIKVVQALDETITFLVVTFNNDARIIFGPAAATPENNRRAVQSLQNVYWG